MTLDNFGSNNYTDNFTVIDSLPVGLEFLKTLNIIGAVKLSEVQNGQVITWILTNIPAKVTLLSLLLELKLMRFR